MKFFPGLAVSAALICAAPAADAQTLAPYDAGKGRLVSDVDGPYVDVPEAPPPAPRYYGYGPDRGYAPDRSYAPDYRYAPDRGYGRDYGYAPAPALLPPQEVYAILRDNGFSPLGIPRQHGYVYVIAVLDRGGEDGRLTIDGRNGRILRFVPASRWGGAYDRMSFSRGLDHRGRDIAPSSGVAVGALPTPTPINNAAPRPPTSLPPVASRGAVPTQVQRPAVVATKPPAQPVQQTAAKPAEAPTQAGPVGEAKPAAAPQIKPSQEMPAVQGLE